MSDISYHCINHGSLNKDQIDLNKKICTVTTENKLCGRWLKIKCEKCSNYFCLTYYKKHLKKSHNIASYDKQTNSQLRNNDTIHHKQFEKNVKVHLKPSIDDVNKPEIPSSFVFGFINDYLVSPTKKSPKKHLFQLSNTSEIKYFLNDIINYMHKMFGEDEKFAKYMCETDILKQYVDEEIQRNGKKEYSKGFDDGINNVSNDINKHAGLLFLGTNGSIQSTTKMRHVMCYSSPNHANGINNTQNEFSYYDLQENETHQGVSNHDESQFNQSQGNISQENETQDENSLLNETQENETQVDSPQVISPNKKRNFNEFILENDELKKFIIELVEEETLDKINWTESCSIVVDWLEEKNLYPDLKEKLCKYTSKGHLLYQLYCKFTKISTPPTRKRCKRKTFVDKNGNSHKSILLDEPSVVLQRGKFYFEFIYFVNFILIFY
jgi:hypothetical protein